MDNVRCPNPECRHEFPAEVWSGAAVVVCPKCDGIFQKSQPEVESPLRPLVIDVAPRESNRWLTLTVAGLLGASAAAVSATVLTQYWQRQVSARSDEPFRSAERNFSFAVPGQPWQSAQDYRDRDFIVAINMRRANPDARFVLALRPTLSGYPAPGVAHADALNFLHHVAGLERIETEPRPETELAGVVARRFVFQAMRGDETMSGDVYSVEYQGYLYWLFRWSSAARLSEAQPGLDDLRNRFKFLDERPNWKRLQNQYQSAKGGFTLTADESIWRQSTFPALRYDPHADLVLESKSAGAAQAVVLVLPLDGAAAQARARSYFQKRIKQEHPDAIVTEENVSAPALSFRVERQPGHGRWYWLFITEHAGSAIVGQCECALEQRENWAPEFARLMGSLKFPD